MQTTSRLVWLLPVVLGIAAPSLAGAQSGAPAARAHDVVVGPAPCIWHVEAHTYAACLAPAEVSAAEQNAGITTPAPVGALGCPAMMRTTFAQGGGGQHLQTRPLDRSATQRDRAHHGHEAHCCYTYQAGCVNAGA